MVGRVVSEEEYEGDEACYAVHRFGEWAGAVGRPPPAPFAHLLRDASTIICPSQDDRFLDMFIRTLDFPLAVTLMILRNIGPIYVEDFNGFLYILLVRIVVNLCKWPSTHSEIAPSADSHCRGCRFKEFERCVGATEV